MGAASEADLEKQPVDDDVVSPIEAHDSEKSQKEETAVPSPPKDEEALDRVPTNATTGSKVSRIVTRLTTRTKREKERLEREKVPETDLDNGLVGWEGQDDPAMPLNFPQRRKWLLLGLISSITLISPLASSMFAPGVVFMDEDFHNTDNTISAFTVSIFVMGYAVGPLFLSPLSEIYGRRPVLGAANVFFTLWQIGCALSPSIAALIVFRFFAGIGGSGCLTIGGGVISDLFRREQRGMATAIYSLGPLLGPVIGPICGGFLAQRAGWRWVFWLLLIAGGITTTGVEILNSETNPKVLIRRKTRALRETLNRPELRSVYEQATEQSKTTIILHGLMRPLKLLFRSPIVLLLSTYMAFVYGLLYFLFTTITNVFIETYHWQPDICGLAYMGVGVGFFIGLGTVAKISDATVIRMTKANNGVFEPEMRLPACVIFAMFIPATFFWYGWSTNFAVHWIVPILGLIPFGIGMIGIFMPIQTYVIDSFPEYAASGVAALTITRSLFGALLPLAAPAMYAKLGLGWGNSLLGFLAIAMIPFPALIYKFGGKIRKGYPVKLD